MARTKRRRVKPRRDNWQGLSEKVQMNILLRVISRLIRPKALRQLSPDVVRAGMGVRKIDKGAGGKPAWKQGQLTLVTYVREKKPKASVRPDRRIPSHLSCRVTIRKKQRRLRIPTDVRTLPGPIRAHALPLATNVTLTSAPQGLAVFGSLCGRFRKVGTGTPIYALTCQHVACASEEQPNLAAAPGATTWSVDDNGNLLSLLGNVAFKTVFGSTNVVDECLDAALIELRPGCDALQSAYWPFSPASAVADQLSLRKEWGSSATLFSRFHPDGIAVSTPTWIPRLVVGFKAQTARISLVVEYELQGDSSQPGDSGSAIVSDSNKLLAMHIAGVDGQPTGYAIPIHLLLDPAAMGVRLQIS